MKNLPLLAWYQRIQLVLPPGSSYSYSRPTGNSKQLMAMDNYEKSRSGKSSGATRVQMYNAAVTHSVQIRTHTVVHPTSISSELSDAALVQPVKSMAEYMLARAKMRWKKVYE
jgi:hypothetical protein